MYKVIEFFTDLQDNNRAYNVGDIFPHPETSYPVSDERIAELMGSENKRGIPLIEKKKTRKKKAADE